MITPSIPHCPQVQDAILHNKRIFEQRLVTEQRALLKRAWQAWLAARLRSASKAALLRKACNRISRGLLSRSFYTWKDELHLVDKTLAMRRKVGGGWQAGGRRGCCTCLCCWHQLDCGHAAACWCGLA